MINLMYVIELIWVDVGENILDFVVLIHYMECEVYEQTRCFIEHKNKKLIKIKDLLVYQHDQENY